MQFKWWVKFQVHELSLRRKSGYRLDLTRANEFPPNSLRRAFWAIKSSKVLVPRNCFMDRSRAFAGMPLESAFLPRVTIILIITLLFLLTTEISNGWSLHRAILGTLFSEIFLSLTSGSGNSVWRASVCERESVSRLSQQCSLNFYRCGSLLFETAIKLLTVKVFHAIWFNTLMTGKLATTSHTI